MTFSNFTVPQTFVEKNKKFSKKEVESKLEKLAETYTNRVDGKYQDGEMSEQSYNDCIDSIDSVIDDVMLELFPDG